MFRVITFPTLREALQHIKTNGLLGETVLPSTQNMLYYKKYYPFLYSKGNEGRS